MEVDIMETNSVELEKFAQASKQCGKCGFQYQCAKDASDCVTMKHNLIRCYFCFKVFRNTEQLFVHYTSGHKQGCAGANNIPSLICIFCDTNVPYKSVSTHVISQHLFNKKNEDEPKVVHAVSPLKNVNRDDDDSDSDDGNVDDDDNSSPPAPKQAKLTKSKSKNELTLKELLSEVKKCGSCHTRYATASEASACINSHIRLRCYQCLKLFRNTEFLFQHFAKDHTQGGREDTISCSFCSKSVPYKSVSCHVISSHLMPDSADKIKENEEDDEPRPSTSKQAKAAAAGGSIKKEFSLPLFQQLAKKCSQCHKVYLTFKEAHNCITNEHKLLRCYQCLQVFQNTKLLFAHYSTDHTQGRQQKLDKRISCCFCDKILSYVNVSFHALREHLYDGSTGKSKYENLQQENDEPRPSTSKQAKATASATPAGSSNKQLSLARFQQLAKKCSHCQKSFPTAEQATDCIVLKHKLVRCYQCLKIYKDTPDLFIHYKLDHKDRVIISESSSKIRGKGKDNNNNNSSSQTKTNHMLCCFCNKKVSFSNLSEHVFNAHLPRDDSQENDKQKVEKKIEDSSSRVLRSKTKKKSS